MRGGREAHTWRAGKGLGQGREGGQTRRTGAPLRVGKGYHVVGGVDSETPFLLCSCACTVSGPLCLCLPPPACALSGSISVCVVRPTARYHFLSIAVIVHSLLCL